jgi:hypothetical protein
MFNYSWITSRKICSKKTILNGLMVYANMKCDIEHKKTQQIARIHNKFQEIDTKHDQNIMYDNYKILFK